MGGILSSECEILLRLASPINKAVANILRLVICALRCLVNVRERKKKGRNILLSLPYREEKCLIGVSTVYLVSVRLVKLVTM